MPNVGLRVAGRPRDDLSGAADGADIRRGKFLARVEADLPRPRQALGRSYCGTFRASPFFSADWWATIPGTVIASAS